MSKTSKIFLGIAGVLVLVSLLAYAALTMWRSGAPGHDLPAQIEGLELEAEFTGADALAAVERSHLGQLQTPDEITIGHYEEGLSVWITEYKKPETATREAARMERAIKKFARGFSAPDKIHMDGQIVYKTLYQGRFQYFWSKDRFLIYVASGPLDQNHVAELIEELP